MISPAVILERLLSMYEDAQKRYIRSLPLDDVIAHIEAMDHARARVLARGIIRSGPPPRVVEH